MVSPVTTAKVAQTFQTVKSSPPPFPSSPTPLSPLPTHNDDDGPISSIDPSSSFVTRDGGSGEGVETAIIPPLAARSELDQLITDLQSVGFDMPMEYLAGKNLARVRAALDYALSKPPGEIKNVPGYIRFLVKSTGRIPKPLPDPVRNKHQSGKYGQMARH